MDYVDLISTIFGFILLILILVGLVIAFIYSLKYERIKGKQEHQYLKSLDEHDRQVIYNYWVASKVRFADVISKEDDDERRTKSKNW